MVLSGVAASGFMPHLPLTQNLPSFRRFPDFGAALIFFEVDHGAIFWKG
jgi:hypothetical protein